MTLSHSLLLPGALLLVHLPAVGEWDRDRRAFRDSTEDRSRQARAAADSLEGPAEWPRDVALFVGILGFDPAASDAAVGLDSRILADGAGIAEYFGDWQAVLPPFVASAALIGGVLEGGTGLKKTLALLGGVVGGSMANEALNQAVGRRRPSEGQGAFAFAPFRGHSSFPSGHAALAFSMAGGVDAVTEHWFPAAAAYSLAGATAASRVHDGDHWVSDAVVGSVIGAVVSRWSTRRMMELLDVQDPASGPRAPPDGSPTFLDRVRPVVTSRLIGLNIEL